MTQEYQLDQSLGYGISTLYALVRAELEGRFKAHGYDITFPQWVLLNSLWDQDGISQAELVKVTLKDKTNIARMVARLEAKGLVERQRSGSDGRQQCVYLTPLGRQLEDQMKPIAAELTQDTFQSISTETLNIVREMVWQVIGNLTTMKE